MKISIFGGGVSGLAAAHELIRNGHTVDLYEADSSLGGLAKTKEISPGVIQERSWRGINNKLYKNLLNIFEDINVSPLTDKFKFLHLKQNGTISESLTPLDIAQISKILLPALMDPDNPKHFSINFKNKIKGKLSEGGEHRVLRMLCPGLGLKEDEVSVGHFANLISTLSVHQVYNGHHWSVTTKPTSEARSAPWGAYLRAKGVNIHLNSTLEKVEFKNKIEHCVVNGCKVKADKYIFALNPYKLYPIVKHILCDEVYNLSKCIESRPTTEIAFQIGFDKQFEYPDVTNVMTFPESEFNITICDQSVFWDKDLGETKSLWSCVACIVPDEYIDEEIFEQEVKRQIFNNKALQKSLGVKDFSKHELWFKIWDTWRFSPEKGLSNENPHWVNSTKTHKYRVNQKTSIENMYFAGAHTKTDTTIFSMEAACESGRRAAKCIDKKCKVKETDSHRFKNLFVFISVIVLSLLLLFILYLLYRFS